MRRWVVIALLWSGCSFEPLTLSGRPCPCIDGWHCATVSGVERCVPDDAADADARDAADAPIDGGPPPRVDAIVAVSRGPALSLDDGSTWCAVPTTLDGAAGGVFDGEEIVVVAADGLDSWTYHSTDGYTWSPRVDMPSSQWMRSIAYGNGVFVTSGGCSETWRSADAREWQYAGRLMSCEHTMSIAFGDGRFVAALEGGAWYASADGLEWTEDRTGAPEQVEFRDGAFVASEVPQVYRGRGVCLRVRNRSTITRSDHADCDFAADVATLPDEIRGFVFVTLPADALTRERMPAALADCLGIATE